MSDLEFTSEPLVSVALPFHNCAPTLAAAVRSILEQTYRNWELLLCDDGSTDDSLACARGYGDPRIVVWSDGARKGLAARLNECIERARGPYIARMDGDDISYPARLETQARFLKQRRDIDLVGTWMLVHGEDGAALGKRVVPAEHGDIVANPALGFGICHPTWLGRSAWFRRFRYSPRALRYEDVELLYRACRESRFANLTEILYGYREPRGGLRKRMTTRLGRVRYLRGSASGSTRPATWRKAALIESAKLAADVGLVTMGLRYAALRASEHPVTASEAAQWQSLFGKLKEFGGGAR